MAQRYFVPSLPPPGASTLRGELAHHLGRVVRARPGETICLADGRGGSAPATVVAVAKDAVQLEVQAARQQPRPVTVLLVAFAPPRLQRAEWLLEHGTEVGIDVFQPLWTERSRPHGERLERWQRIALAAAGQCGRDWLPEVRAARELALFLSDPTLPTHRLVATEGAPPLSRRRRAPTGPAGVVWLVGPEGGFTEAEQHAIAAAGFAACGLGPHTLRTETAALVGAAWLRAGEFADPGPGR
ncbi:MAG TPA: RsmE family RNA methyltransferase [Planctomycetota bacterium]|nr:RsmE family RNA methyltransferase [Planctomycetota bacterium]